MAVMRNGAVIQFPAPTANWSRVTHFGVWDASTGGNFLGGDNLTTARTPLLGSDVEFANQAFSLTVPHGGDVTDEGARDLLRGWGNQTLYFSLHTADPGQTGANELSGSGYARAGNSSWSYAAA